MAFNIEILTTDEKLYTDIARAYEPLNQVQKDFKFEVTSDSYKKQLYVKQSQNYKTQEVFEWVKQFRDAAKGHRPFVIVVVDDHLESTRLTNIFGSVAAKQGIAVFTTDDFEHFVYDKIRYIRYYLVRYAISFLQPEVKSHDDPERKYCIFHKKIRKIEIRESLNSGEICEQCFEVLAPKLTLDIRKSVDALLKVVSNQYPFALIVKGGGVKGLAFAGALLELENYFSFDTFAGTSAGAIASLLLGAGYKPKELLKILKAKDFKDFKDASLIGSILNFIKTRGLYPGDEIEKWLNELLSDKHPNKLSTVSLEELEHHIIIYSSRIEDGTLTFDSQGERKETHAAFAARCSMSIPYFFCPKYVDGIRVFDGGLRNNFPLKTFKEQYPEKPFLGMFLVSDSKKGGLVIGELINIAIEGEEIKTVEKYIDQMIVIDPRPIKTTDFNLTDSKKKYLVTAGRIGALKFVQRTKPEVELDLKRMESLEKKLKKLKKKI